MTRAEVRVDRAIRACTLAVFAAGLVLAPRQFVLIGTAGAVRVDDGFFPDVLRGPALLAFGWILPLCSAVPALIRPRSPWSVLHACALTIGSAILLVHQASYFFATWVVDLWIGVFLLWLVPTARRDAAAACREGPFLVQLLIAFWFLGGAAGKWTAEWWAGDEARALLVLPQRTLVTHLVVERYGTDAALMARIGTWVSRLSVMIETALVGVVLLPGRVAFGLVSIVAAGMWLMISYNLFEIMWPIAGIAAAGWCLSGD